MTHRTDHRLTFMQSILCSGVSAVLGRTLTAPADVIRTLIQVGIPLSKEGSLTLIKFTYIRDGPRAFFKGNLIGCMKLVPYSITQYLVFNRIRWNFSDDFVAGTLSGMTATILTYPMDLIKTRLIVQPLCKKSVQFKGITRTFLNIVKHEGPKQLYHGLSPTLAAAVPYTFTAFLTYESLDLLRTWRQGRNIVTPTMVLLQGIISSTVSIIVTFPFDVIRKMMQAKSGVLPNNGGVDLRFTTSTECGRQLVRTYGIRGLWRGLTPALIRVLPYHSIMFASYEMCKRGFLYHNGYILSPFQEMHAPIDQNIGMDELREIQEYDIVWHNEHYGESETVL